jgi:hypothetical protein
MHHPKRRSRQQRRPKVDRHQVQLLRVLQQIYEALQILEAIGKLLKEMI